MSSAQKIIQAAAGNAGGGPGPNVEELFSTYLYEGNGSTQTITNGIDLAGEGGMVWAKSRSNTQSHNVHDTERGGTKSLQTNVTTQELTIANAITSFNSDGFTLGGGWNTVAAGNIASWTFRKAPKFFDVVTYTGDGVAGREIAHNLGCKPGMIIIKSTSDVRNWIVWFNDESLLTSGFTGFLNNNNAFGSGLNAYFDYYGLDPNNAYVYDGGSDAVFRLGSDSQTNGSGFTYVAYLFAHNDGDGNFGETGDQDIIKCGSYTGNGTFLDGPEIDLGFEPQWLLIKSTGSESWRIADNMRGIAMGTAGAYLSADLNNLEAGSFGAELQPTGFKVTSNNADLNSNGQDYIYLAIRRGPMKTPESGTEVFAMDTWGGGPPAFTSGFPVDMAFTKDVDSNGPQWYWVDRLRGLPSLSSDSTAAETTAGLGTDGNFDFQDGWYNKSSTVSDYQSWMFRRAPGFFDVVAYTGDGSSSRSIPHNLGVVPEMMIFKQRNDPQVWAVYHKDLTGKYLILSGTNAGLTDGVRFLGTSSTDVTLGSDNDVNQSTYTYIAYLFASLPGVSKVGSYTADASGNVASIDLGFVPRFVLIKSTTDTTSWLVYDTVRGIPDGDDPVLVLNTTNGEPSNPGDRIDLTATGFELEPNSGSVSEANETYIYLAIA